ncbi:ABC transporter substrate-binding protein [Jiella sonneratiae]|uniref:ABC transporter substrate-binding protein n=1 Tax=Jiella sonneratiae TaxID=2816856 RepID=A0ABS3JAA9_9HYPH|nr:ABC transporter substrate-binding protein [Jiella sonneratiae]
MTAQVSQITRRAALAGLGASAFAGRVPRADAAGVAGAGRVAVVDWALLETFLALGLPPAAAPELILYRRLVVEPAVPETVADLGLRGALSFERLAMIRPDVVYGSNYSAWAAPQIERIARFRIFDLFLPGEPPLARIEAMTVAVAAECGIAGRGRGLVADGARRFAEAREALRTASAPPVLLVDVGDAGHVRVFGADSLFGDTLSRLGLENAWRGGTRYSANAPVGIERLAAFPDAFLVGVGPVPPDARRAIETGALWRALPAVAAGRFALLPPCDAFGALPAATRFAGFLTDALLHRSGRSAG